MSADSDDRDPDGTGAAGGGQDWGATASEGLIGQVLEGRYHVERRIGAGGMATVYLAWDEKLDRRTALKIPHAALLAGTRTRERFEREVRSLVLMEHPGVVKIHDVGRAGDTPFLIMQYLSGGSLQGRLDARPSHRQEAAEVLEWLEPLAGTLDSLQSAGLVHRDVKADNILFDAGGRPHLADFGVAKALAGGAETLTAEGSALGSVRTMAPEQCLGKTVSGAADQYALAATAYEALSGHPVFEGETTVEVLAQKTTQEAPQIGLEVPRLPAPAAAAVMRGLAREPSERHPSCLALVREFRSGLDATGAAGSPTALRVAILAVGALLLLAVGAWLGRRGGDGEEGLASMAERVSEKPVPSAQPVVDTAPPVIAVRTPAGTRFESATEVVRIRGSVAEDNLKELTANGLRVLPDASGEFEWPVTLEAGQELTVRFEAKDHAGNEATPVVRTLALVPPSPATLSRADPPNASPRSVESDSDPRQPPRLEDVGRVVMLMFAPPDTGFVNLDFGGSRRACSIGDFVSPSDSDPWRFKITAIESSDKRAYAIRYEVYAKDGTEPLRSGTLTYTGAAEREMVPPAVAERVRLQVPAWAKVSERQVEEAEQHGVPVAFENELGMRFVLIPAGTFWMGSSEAETAQLSDPEWWELERPRHRVTLSRPYYLQVTEVTNAQYRRFRSSHDRGSSPVKDRGRDDLPVVSVTWQEATDFAAWASELDVVRRYLLPTEAQWEHACRADTETPYNTGRTITKRLANYGADHVPGRAEQWGGEWAASKVGAFHPNAWGLYDMHGNVCEWCADWYGRFPAGPLTDPTGPSSGEERTFRGGCYSNDHRQLRSAYRHGEPPDGRLSDHGFRVMSPLP